MFTIEHQVRKTTILYVLASGLVAFSQFYDCCPTYFFSVEEVWHSAGQIQVLY